MSRGVRIGLKIAASLTALLLILAAGAVLVLRSDWFHDKVRQRIVAELESATGGTATLGNYSLDWRATTFEFQDLTLRGTEPASAPPLLHAKSIQVGLKIVSFLKKDVDIASAVVREPKVNLIVAADGSTNIPQPKVKSISGKIGLEPILDWKIGKFSLENGEMLFAEQKSGLNARGENLHAQFSYDATGPRYKGQLSIQPLELNARAVNQVTPNPVNMNVFLVLGLEKNRIEISNAKFDVGRSNLEASGAIEGLTSSSKGVFRFTAHVAVDQAGKLLKIGMARQGTLEITGSANYNSASDFTVLAGVSGRGLDVLQDGIHFSGARLTSKAILDPRGLRLEGVVVDVLGGRFTGRADFPRLEIFIVDGAVRDMPIDRTLATFTPTLPASQTTAWSGLASGPVHFEGGLRGGRLVATAKVEIAPAAGGIPVQGSVDLRYDAESETVGLGRSHLQTAGATVDLSGTLGTRLEVQVASTNLKELLPAINVFSAQPVNSLPVELISEPRPSGSGLRGKATFDGTVSGKLNAPHIGGAVSLSNFVYSGIDFDSFNGQVTVDPTSAHVQDATLARGAAQARITTATVSLNDWDPEPASAVAATATLRGTEISELLSLAGEKEIPVRGALAASLRLSGTFGNPHAGADITVTKGVAYDEPFDRLQATVDYSPQAIAARQATLTVGTAKIDFTASFEPASPFTGSPDFRNGRAQFHVASNDMAIQRFEVMKRLRPDLAGTLRVNFDGSADIRSAQALLTSLKGDAAAGGLRLDNRSLGNATVTADTQSAVLRLKLDSNFLNSKQQATGQWRLQTGYPGEANLRFSEISVAAVRDWLTKPGERSGLNFDGSAEGTVSIAGSALAPREWKASANLSKLEVFPIDQGLRKGVTERFTLRNAGPVVLTMHKSVISVASGHFSGPSTDITVSGSVAMEPKTLLDLRLNGGVNLAVVRTFQPDIETTGTVAINASIRGAPDDPQVNGQLEIKRGTLHFADITSGLSAVNGTIVFSGNQGTIQNITGQVGGGAITLRGVVGYAGGELSYRVDATAKNVRVRYPEGASTSANAELSLRGTTQRSMLSGTLMVLRTGFNPRTDFSSILGKASEPVRTPSARAGLLGGMQFDVRIETAPDISFESSLAQDLQVEGSLRLQGTANNPVLLGRLNITQGEINFFGTEYFISQGSITFANPVKLEPVLNIDLDTKVQGIAVTLTVSGPLTHLNLTPRSDPPMQYSDVLALLATGAKPSSDPTLAARQNTPQQSFTQLGASTVIGQVVANPLSNRLQRFFGVSKLKIDPQFTGVENNPQARLTLEQQVTKSVTFTYITNIAAANQLIVRIEWALNKNWSAIAVRDENGLFGLDFLYKKRFK